MSIDQDNAAPRLARPAAQDPVWRTIASAALMLVGSLGPWATALGQSQRTPPSTGVLALSLVCLAVLVPELKRRRGRKRLWFVTGVGVLGLLNAVGTLIAIHEASQQYFGLVQPGWGIWVTMLGSAATVMTSLRIPRAR
jgi:hypothetical protein